MADGSAAIVLDDVTVTAAAPAKAAATDDTVTIEIAGKRLGGWQAVAISRLLDNVPATFDLKLTERYPNSPDIDIKPGAPCKVLIGSDVVITGYVDRYSAAYSAGDHTVHVTGRSKSADLVDCAAFFDTRGGGASGEIKPEQEGYQSPGGSVLKIAKALAAPYGIEVQTSAGEGDQIPLFNIIFGETAWEIIERLARSSALLAYDMPDGSLMLATAGIGTMGSGFVQGVNIETAEVSFSMDQRFSLYEGFNLSTGVFTTESAQTGGAGQVPMKVEHDSGVPRFRKRIIVETMMDHGTPLIEKRVPWEMNHRMGRSQAVTVTCDSWRDVKGLLWAPNYLAPIKVPALKLPDATWCIGSVAFTRDETGQHATVVLMPKEAFLPEPAPYMPLPASLDQLGIAPNNPTAKEPPA